MGEPRNLGSGDGTEPGCRRSRFFLGSLTSRPLELSGLRPDLRQDVSEPEETEENPDSVHRYSDPFDARAILSFHGWSSKAVEPFRSTLS